jgi:hypothetical protein
MKITTIIILAIAFVSGVWVGEKITFAAFRNVQDSEWQIREREYEQAIRTVARLAMCESSYRPRAVGDGGKSRGPLQYQAATFARHSTLAGRQDLRWGNPEDQFVLALWAVRNGYGREWTCYEGD